MLKPRSFCKEAALRRDRKGRAATHKGVSSHKIRNGLKHIPIWGHRCEAFELPTRHRMIRLMLSGWNSSSHRGLC